MAKIGRLHKLPNGDFQLQYWDRRDLKYQVEETTPQWKMFKTKKEALKFIERNNIKLEKGGEQNEG